MVFSFRIHFCVDDDCSPLKAWAAMRAASDDTIEESEVESPAEMFKTKDAPIGAAPTESNKGKFSQMMSGMASKAKGLKKKMKGKGKGKKSKQAAGAVGDGEGAEEVFRPRSGAGSAPVSAGTCSAGVGADTGADAADVAVGAGDASNGEGDTSPPLATDAPVVNEPAEPEAEQEKEDPVKTAAVEKLAKLKATLAAATKKAEEKKAAAGVAVVPVAVNPRVASAVPTRSKGGIGKGKRTGSRKGLMGDDHDGGGEFAETSFAI
jgi:hypothetical protein